MVLYRKYRPQMLEELIGQTSVKQSLTLALSQNKLSHAYLFCGPRGTGKTSTARILAKMVNCEGASQEKSTTKILNPRDAFNLPCNQCSSCISITDGSNLDVVEMDAASNRGIDDIRSLRENIKLATSAAKKKVYIIDEVHMLSNDAFNALLKTLEEPPAHVLFVLATTEVQKIPQTILSRVTRLDFKQATIEELIEALKKVADAEKIEISPEALVSVAKHAQGSFRDGIKLLDLLSSLGKIDQETVEKTFNTGVFESICLFLKSIAEQDAAEALKILTKEIQTGVHAKELTISILDILRQLLFIKHGLGQQLVKTEIGPEKYSALENLAAKFSVSQVVTSIDNFQKSLDKIRYASIPSLPLEIAAVENCGVQKDSEELRQSAPIKPEPDDQVIRKSKKENLELRSSDLSDSPDLRVLSSPSGNNFAEVGIDSGSDIQKIKERWAYVLETVKQYNFSLEALLRLVKLLECGESNIVIEVPYAFHQRILEAPKSRDLLESVLSDIVGRPLKVATVLGSRPMRKEELANVEVAADDEIIRIASEIFNAETVN